MSKTDILGDGHGADVSMGPTSKIKLDIVRLFSDIYIYTHNIYIIYILHIYIYIIAIYRLCFFAIS